MEVAKVKMREQQAAAVVAAHNFGDLAEKRMQVMTNVVR